MAVVVGRLISSPSFLRRRTLRWNNARVFSSWNAQLVEYRCVKCIIGGFRAASPRMSEESNGRMCQKRFPPPRHTLSSSRKLDQREIKALFHLDIFIRERTAAAGAWKINGPQTGKLFPEASHFRGTRIPHRYKIYVPVHICRDTNRYAGENRLAISESRS